MSNEQQPILPEVHILKAGGPLCNFTDKVPAEWPPLSRWISYSDYVSGKHDVRLTAVLCPTCAAEAEGGD